MLGTVSSGNGIQISPVLNCTEDGVGDLRNDLERGRESEWNGLQLAFLANRACYLNGVQLAAGMNYAVRCRGIQVSAWNRADELEGIQFGLFNRAWSGSGVQIGLFNVFGSEENADLIPLPLLNARF